MESVLEKTKTQFSSAELEAQKHNAMINERYRLLQSAEADQFAEANTFEQMNENTETSIYTSVEDSAALEQAPQVTEYVQTRSSSALFTAEKFDRMQGYENTQAPAAISAPVTAARVKSVAQYSLTPFAKIAMAIFTLVIVAMITLICVNTHIINQKNIKLKNLEKKKEQLMEQSEELQRRIDEARSEETIRAYAAAQGW
ncbi:MAG: hypothetical protein IJ393_04990 [Clostridia bacterium]|nr:hypothetical protein [Clostridia bacterium]